MANDDKKTGPKSATYDDLTSSSLGLHSDNSPLQQPEGTYPFALNAVSGSRFGNSSSKAREVGNVLYANLPIGFTPIGKVYIGDGETALFLVKDDVSEIGILDADGEYTTHVNDKDSPEGQKLGFRVENQISAIYRLRRGCQKTIYFVGKKIRPMLYDFYNPEKFKNSGSGHWDSRLFNLQKLYSRIPEFSKFEVLDTGGSLLPGSYNFSIQYIDRGLNPTEWINSSAPIIIYNDPFSLEYRDINGSMTSTEDYMDYKATDKAIKITVARPDRNYDFFRLAIIVANTGSGQINEVQYTSIIPIEQSEFTYTGENFETTGTETEILSFTDVIEQAESVEQLQNMLMLGNIQGNQSDFCKLQKYASRITADCVIKTINLSSLDFEGNPKRASHRVEDVGYMPGEIYSFAIVYILEDGLSPAYHIPGRSPLSEDDKVYSPDVTSSVPTTFPMSKINGVSGSYTSIDECGGSNYWGNDCEGVPLKGKQVRHHRFPLRSELNIPLVRSSKGQENVIPQYQLQLNVNGNLLTPIICEEGDVDCTPTQRPGFEIKVEYLSGGESFEFYQSVNPDQYAFGEESFLLGLTQVSPYHLIDDFSQIKVSISDSSGEYNEIDLVNNVATYTNNHGQYFDGNATLKITKERNNTVIQDISYETDILGIKFSGIELPESDEKGNKIIGYYIVRNERTEFEKSILDSGVLIPTIENEKYIGQGLLNPEEAKLEKSVYGVIHPEHKFKDRKYTIYDEIIQQGNFKVTDVEYGKINYDDVYDGSSYDGSRQKGGNDDGHAPSKEAYTRGFDGFSFNAISRDSILEYEDKNTFTFGKTDIKEHFYLSALESRSINKGANDVYNIAADNQIGIIQLEDGVTIEDESKLPYVVFKRNNLNSYSNFRLLPYYMDSKKPQYFSDNHSETSETTIFSGDSYVSPMRYVNTVFWDNRVAKRVGKSSALTVVVGIFVAVVGAVLAIFTAGGSSILIGLGIAMIGGGVLILSSGIKQDNWNKAYLREYDKGLRFTALDIWVKTFYEYTNRVVRYFPIPWTGQTEHAWSSARSGPSDDTIQWIGDCLTNLWFESSININLRVKMSSGVPNFLPAPGKIESGQNSPISIWEFFGAYYADSNQKRYPISSFESHIAKKLLAFDPERNDGHLLIGVPLGEYYKINPDYERKNVQKIFAHLPIEYDCCSDCKEAFPHRWRWSQQSFQEELTDNYQVFLPNNYKDIEGESGEIVNFFTLGERFYIHTKEALYEVPKNQQERVTDQIVSFIGTGSYFDIPPRKIVDSFSGNSAGLQHKWGATKTDVGYFFVCESQRTIFQFNGQNLIPISKYGISKWFWNNLKVNLDEKYKKITKSEYPFRDNPSNLYGTGFIAAQDLENNRVIFTKKDLDLSDSLFSGGSDFRLTIFNNILIKFENYQSIINQKILQGYTFLGIIDGKMKFSTEVLVEKDFVEHVWIPPVYENFTWYGTGVRGINSRENPIVGDPEDPEIVFPDPCQSPCGEEECILGGKVTFKQYIPGQREEDAEWVTWTCLYEEDCIFIEHWGSPLLMDGQVDYHHPHSHFPPIPNPNGFPDYPPGEQSVIADCSSQSNHSTDDRYLIRSGYYDTVTVKRSVIETVYETVGGVIIQNAVKNNRSWTISFSVENPQAPFWVSWHSFLPNFYITARDRFFSWVASENNIFAKAANSIWEHNKAKTYCTYYGKEYPYILEYVLISTPVREKIYNHIGLSTIALKYNENTKQEYENRLITFNKAVVYNSHQCSGMLELKVEDKDEVDFMMSRVRDQDTTSLTRDKEMWFMNDLRDIRVNYNDSIWNSSEEELQGDYYIDKVLNVSTLDEDKSWEQLESFKGKYLIVRLIFDKFADVNLISNFIVNNETLT